MSQPSPTPTVGRIVLYTTAELFVRAAIVSDVEADGTLTLHVLNPHPDKTDSCPVAVLYGIRYFDGRPGCPAAVGRWTWPPRVMSDAYPRLSY